MSSWIHLLRKSQSGVRQSTISMQSRSASPRRRRAHDGIFQRRRIPLRIRARGARRISRGLRCGRGQVQRPNAGHLPQRRASRSASSIPQTGTKSSTSWKMSASSTATEIEAKITSPDSTGRSSKKSRNMPLEHEERNRAVSQDSNIRCQRPAAHVPCRSARRHSPRRIRSR